MSLEPSFPRDQATLLRMLAKRALMGGSAAFPEAKICVLFGGTHQVGTTTLCHNLACALGLAGNRVAAIDLNPANRGLAEQSGRTPQVSIDELVSSCHDLHEYLVPGVAASLLLPTDTSPLDSPWLAASVDRFIQQLTGLGRHADVLLIDAGCELSTISEQLWRVADVFWVVLQPTADAITAAYERVRTLQGATPRRGVGVVMNRASSPSGHVDLVAGMDSTAQRFLALAVESAGHVEVASEIGAACRAAQPFIQRYAEHAASRSIQRIADRLVRESLKLAPVPGSRRAA